MRPPEEPDDYEPVPAYGGCVLRENADAIHDLFGCPLCRKCATKYENGEAILPWQEPPGRSG